MRISYDKIEISSTEAIFWDDVERMRLLNDKLALVLRNGRVIELDHMHPGMVDSAFKAYERYLREARRLHLP